MTSLHRDEYYTQRLWGRELWWEDGWWWRLWHFGRSLTVSDLVEREGGFVPPDLRLCIPTRLMSLNDLLTEKQFILQAFLVFQVGTQTLTPSFWGLEKTGRWTTRPLVNRSRWWEQETPFAVRRWKYSQRLFRGHSGTRGADPPTRRHSGTRGPTLVIAAMLPLRCSAAVSAPFWWYVSAFFSLYLFFELLFASPFFSLYP